MKAIICTKYGPPSVLKMGEIDKPVPNDNEILIRVRASSINSADHRMMMAKPFFVRFMGEGFLQPKKNVPGIDMAGVVEEAGKNVTKFKPGDEVFGDVNNGKNGAYAEYTCIDENANIVIKPDVVTFEQAGSIPVAGLTALQALRDHGKVKEDQSVLVNGASGSVGTFTVILAKAFGAEVTGVCSTRNLELIKSIGADYVIDYKKDDFKTSEKKFDIIIDIAANIRAKDYIKLLKPNGTGILVGFSSISHMIGIGLKSRKLKKKNGLTVKAMGSAKAKKDDLVYLGELTAAGKISPEIEKVYPLEETPEAMRYFDEEHARAKVVISMQNIEKINQ
jgi:NADPH:quinone reductase-like Zn-dependent oxidoreductase